MNKVEKRGKKMESFVKALFVITNSCGILQFQENGNVTKEIILKAVEAFLSNSRISFFPPFGMFHFVAFSLLLTIHKWLLI
jgi:hypothetical protein